MVVYGVASLGRRPGTVLVRPGGRRVGARPSLHFVDKNNKQNAPLIPG